jgi:hypothetical protein
MTLNLMALKRWQRYAVIGVFGGGLAYAGWVGFIHPVTAEQAPASEVTFNDRPAAEGVWARSTPMPAPSCPSCPADGEVCRPLIDAAAYSGPFVPPADPSAPALLPQQITIPVGPRQYEAGLTGPGVPLPEIPAVPETPVLQQPMPFPLVASEPVQKISATTIYANQPSSLPVPVPTMSSPVNLEISAGSRGGSDGAMNLAPATPPLKFPEQVQPVMPIPADSRLPSSDGWLNVKMENPPSGGVPNIPPAPEMLPVPPVGQPRLPIPSTSPQPLPIIPSVGIPGGSMGLVVDRPKAIEEVLPRSEKDIFAFPVHHDSPEFIFGENNMLLTHNNAAVMAVVGGMFMAPTAPVLADDKPDVAALKSQMEETNKKLKDIQEDIRRLNELLAGKKDDTGTAIPTKGGVVEQLKDLQNRLQAIEQSLDKLKNQTSTSLRQGNPALPPNPIVETKPTGTVRVINQYPVPISMVINNVPHKIEPNKTLDVPVYVGEFTYQLVESGAAPTKSHIKDGETVTLRIK